MSLYYSYSQFLKDKYGVKTYKLPINLPLTCPNRDGTLGEGGCVYCGEDGASFEEAAFPESIFESLIEKRNRIGKKYNAQKFIAYFQNFTNTYLPLDQLSKYVREVQKVEDIVEISFSTRPDCINEEYIEKMDSLADNINLSFEFGLQTVNYHTLIDCNRRHTLAELLDAVLSAHKYELEVGVHLILNLPGDDMTDVIENAKILSALKVENVKLHALYIEKGTEFAERYKKGELDIISKEEYIERVITFLEYLDPNIAVQRFLGRAPADKTLFVNWDQDSRQIHQQILEEMEERNTHQGQKFDYLQGKALRKFE